MQVRLLRVGKYAELFYIFNIQNYCVYRQRSRQVRLTQNPGCDEFTDCATNDEGWDVIGCNEQCNNGGTPTGLSWFPCSCQAGYYQRCCDMSKFLYITLNRNQITQIKIIIVLLFRFNVYLVFYKMLYKTKLMFYKTCWYDTNIFYGYILQCNNNRI